MSSMQVRIGLAAAAIVVFSVVTIAYSRALVSPAPASTPRETEVAVAQFAGVPASEVGVFRLGGLVYGADGAALANALVCDHPAFDAPTTCVRTAESGSFAIPAPRGFHKLEVLAPSGSHYLGGWYPDRDRSREATLLDLRTSERADLVVRLGIGRRVQGRVLGPGGRPIGDAQACAGPTETPAEWICARTDAQGRYVVVVPDGDYQVFFVPPEDTRLIPRWWRNGDQVLAAETLTVQSDLTGIDVSVVEGHLIHGRLTSTSGKPVEHTLVCVDTRFPTGRVCRPTNENGDYSVAVRTGSFQLQFRTSPASGVVGAWYGGDADPRSARLVFVGGDVRVDATLRSGRILWGRVYGEDGVPLESTNLSVYDASAACCVYVTGGATAASGDYGIVVPPGRFWLEAFPALGYAYISSFYGGTPTAANARIIEVREKDTDVLADVTLRLFREP